MGQEHVLPTGICVVGTVMLAACRSVVPRPGQDRLGHPAQPAVHVNHVIQALLKGVS